MNTTPSTKSKPAVLGSVIKQPISIPIPLFKWAQRQAKKAAKAKGPNVRPNLSGYLVSLIQQAKDTETK